MRQFIPPRRTNTPPRLGSAPIRLLRICLDDLVLGGVEINETSTLADVRRSISDDEIGGVPETYHFLFGGAPVSRRQESRRRAMDCFPFLTMIQGDTRICAPTAALNSDGGEPGGSATPSTSLSRVAAEVHPVVPSPEGRATVDLESGGTGVSLGGAGGTRSPPASFGVPPGHGASQTTASQAVGQETGAGSNSAASQDNSATATLELQITDGPLEGTTVTVGEEGARIGRHTSNTLVIPEAGISRQHCEVCFVDGDFCVRDQGSTTGTYFYLRAYGQFHMFPGLMIKLGETELQVISQAPPGSEHPELVVLFYEGPLAGHKIRIPASGIRIGRRHDNNLVLVHDGTVSAHHAVIFLDEGGFFISDVGSCNGTCVRLSPERADSAWHPIMDGDVIGAGCTKIRCRVRRI